MHRGGTSLTASWLRACGLTIHDGELMGPGVGNSAGHFEDLDFVELHSSAIRRRIPKSHGWKVFSEGFLTLSDDESSRAKELASKRNEKYDTWGWKDPRSVLFLKQWKAIVPEARVLLIWRPCYDTAISLIRRSRNSNQRLLKVSWPQSVKLWISYNERVCDYKQKYPDDTLLLPMYYIINHDQTVLNLLNNRFETSLRYHPISGIFNPALLHVAKTPLLLRLLGFYYTISRIEKRLENLSDVHFCSP